MEFNKITKWLEGKGFLKLAAEVYTSDMFYIELTGDCYLAKFANEDELWFTSLKELKDFYKRKTDEVKNYKIILFDESGAKIPQNKIKVIYKGHATYEISVLK